eukprot:2982403-Pleurochrysis_carterae.AAC.2
MANVAEDMAGDAGVEACPVASANFGSPPLSAAACVCASQGATAAATTHCPVASAVSIDSTAARPLTSRPTSFPSPIRLASTNGEAQSILTPTPPLRSTRLPRSVPLPPSNTSTPQPPLLSKVLPTTSGLTPLESCKPEPTLCRKQLLGLGFTACQCSTDVFAVAQISEWADWRETAQTNPLKRTRLAADAQSLTVRSHRPCSAAPEAAPWLSEHRLTASAATPRAASPTLAERRMWQPSKTAELASPSWMPMPWASSRWHSLRTTAPLALTPTVGADAFAPLRANVQLLMSARAPAHTTSALSRQLSMVQFSLISSDGAISRAPWDWQLCMLQACSSALLPVVSSSPVEATAVLLRKTTPAESFVVLNALTEQCSIVMLPRTSTAEAGDRVSLDVWRMARLAIRTDPSSQMTAAPCEYCSSLNGEWLSRSIVNALVSDTGADFSRSLEPSSA